MLDAVLMVPFVGVPPAAALLRSPKGFRFAEGVLAAWPSDAGPFGRTPRISGSPAQRAGLRYERKAQKYLASLFGASYQPSPWFKFDTMLQGLRWCQPDGIVYDDKRSACLLIEIKTRSCIEAWWQLHRLYEPVVRMAMRPATIATLMVCKYFDPATPFPDKPRIVADPRERSEGFSAFVWRP